MAAETVTSEDKVERRKAKTELRNARKTFKTCEERLRAAKRDYDWAADRLMTAAAKAGEPA